MKRTRKALLSSIISLVLCFSMLLGTTWAWFTDEVTSGGNIIQSGTLKAAMFWSDTGAEGTFQDASQGAIFNYEHWEPGFTQIKYVKVENTGNLAFRYMLNIIPSTLPVAGEANLADVIDVYFAMNPQGAITRENVSTTMQRAGTLSQLMATAGGAVNGVLLPTSGSAKYDDILAKEANAQTGTTTYCVALKMQEAAGNEYQNKTVNGSFAVQLLASQYTYESDSFGNDYDGNSEWPYVSSKYSVTQTITDKIDPATGNLTESILIGTTSDAQYATIPAEVKLDSGADKLTFTITSVETPAAAVETTSRDEILRSVDIHVEGIAEDNTVPMTFVLKELFPKGLNENNVKLYHVEGEETNEMDLVGAPANHNEFSYDPLTGDAVITIATFSEIAAYADTNAPWDGKTFDYSWYNADAAELTIANANQFVAFRNIVDGVKIDGVYTIDDFKDQKIILGADINLNGHNFDPIGWGYDNTAWNAGSADGKVFKGHFDGDNHTIYGLYQDGWDLESATGTDYTYTNCGGGLFAAALDATFENLTIDGADIRFECVEIGVLVGLAQGNCTFENINILGSKIANYQRPAGGVVGEVSPKVEKGAAVTSTHTFNNVYVDSNTVVGSMWGDFDAPVGGVIGAYWDDAGETSVNMNKVTVAARLDVYNDVTSTYQWYAYRRAGMLIGNSDRADGHDATATYLTCSNVTVYYGEWADYHYCEFNKANPNWPWVRVEPGENCDGYSNPRWGRPIDSTTGQPVTDSVHEHGEGEGHLQSIPFHQLYGGGQGVYGAESHPGVSEGIYTVTYMDRGKILRVDNVKDNNVAYTAPNIKTVIPNAADGTEPSYWVDANGVKFTGFAAGRTANAIVYPKWPNEYTIRCLDTYGEVAYYNFVTDDNTTDAEYEAIAADINSILADIQNEVDKDKKVIVIKWKDSSNKILDTVKKDTIKNAKADLILTAVPELVEGSITLEPVYDSTTGQLVWYKVTNVVADDSNINVVIPEYVGTVPVSVISAGAAGGFDNLHCVTIPVTVTEIGKAAFSDKSATGSGETITIYYEGSYDDWKKIDLKDGWANGLGGGTRVFFLNGGDTVDTTQGYLERKASGFIFYSYSWQEKTTFTSALKAEYTGKCDCKTCKASNLDRPDAIYWKDVTVS